MDKYPLIVTKSKGIKTKFDKLNNTTMNDFKIPGKYLIDFDSLKVGDRVWGIREGYTKVINLVYNDMFPIVTTEGKTYTNTGRFGVSHSHPSLFRSNPFEDIREEFFADTLMEVRNGNGRWYKRVVIGRKNEQWFAWDGIDCLEDEHNAECISSWDEARPITPPSEELVHLTLKDISEGKGVGVPAHLIRIKE